MDSDYSEKYKNIIEKIDDLLINKELGPELEEVFSYYREVLIGSMNDKKHNVAIMVEDLISRVKDFPDKNKWPKR